MGQHRVTGPLWHPLLRLLGRVVPVAFGVALLLPLGWSLHVGTVVGGAADRDTPAAANRAGMAMMQPAHGAPVLPGRDDRSAGAASRSVERTLAAGDVPSLAGERGGAAARIDVPTRAGELAATEPPEPPPPAPIPLAEGAGVRLVVPARPGTPAVVGFHQASDRGAVVLRPLGEQLVDADAVEPSGELPVDPEAAPHLVMGSRGRGTDGTSAVDVALAEDDLVVAPVSGEVVTASRYTLYGQTDDVTVAIAPDGVEGQVVEMFHLDDPQVEVGDRVEAGVTPLATVRLLPFGSQIDRFTDEAGPHVHIEVRAS